MIFLSLANHALITEVPQIFLRENCTNLGGFLSFGTLRIVMFKVCLWTLAVSHVFRKHDMFLSFPPFFINTLQDRQNSHLPKFPEHPKLTSKKLPKDHLEDL